MRLVKVDQPAELQLERRLVVFEVDGLEGLGEIHERHDETGLEACHVGRRFAVRLNAVILTGGVHGVPEFQRQLTGDPELVAEVAGEAGPRDPQRLPVEREMPNVEGLCGLDVA